MPAKQSTGDLGRAMAVRWRVALLVGALLGLSLGIVLGRSFHRGTQTDAAVAEAGSAVALGQAASPGASRPEDAVRMRVALEAGAAERALLSAELELLREEVDALRLALAEARGGVAPEPGLPAPAPRPGAQPGPPRPGHAGSRPWFDGDALARAGFAAQEVERLRERWEQFELDKLYLADEAARRKAAGQPRQRGAVADLAEEFRAEVGEDGYDAYLYATGQHNRVVVGELLQDSPAMISGFQQGDVVLRYEDERIFVPRELQRASRTGVGGEVIRVMVLRGGERVSLTLPRGPLGVRLKTARLAPERY